MMGFVYALKEVFLVEMEFVKVVLLIIVNFAILRTAFNANQDISEWEEIALGAWTTAEFVKM